MNNNEELDGVIVCVAGKKVAWFADPEEAHEWASDVYFGQWLMSPYAMPNKPLFTDAQLAEARAWAEDMFNHFSENKQAD